MKETRFQQFRSLAKRSWRPFASILASIAVGLAFLKKQGVPVPDGVWPFLLAGAAVLILVRFPRFAIWLDRLIFGPPPPLPDEPEIFRGLRGFDKGDELPARRADTGTCWGLLQAHPFFILDGESGSGKSSFLRAALVPIAEERYRPVIGRLTEPPLRDFLAKQKVSTEAVEKILAEIVEANKKRKDERPVLFCLDQFEELFISVRDKHRLRLLKVLKEAVQVGLIRLLLILRSDFYDLLAKACLEVDPERTVLDTGRYYTLRPFRRDQAQEALETLLRPMHEGHPVLKLQFDDLAKALAEELLRPPQDRRLCRDDEQTVLPVELQIVGTMIVRRDLKTFSAADLRRVGKVELLRQFLEDAKKYASLKAIVPPDQTLTILRKLISPAGSRLARTAAEVAPEVGLAEDKAESLLRAFAEIYLVKPLPGDAGKLRHELMHDYLKQVLAEATQPELQRVRDAEERLTFWLARTQPALYPPTRASTLPPSGQPPPAAPVPLRHPVRAWLGRLASPLGRFRSWFAQPIPISEVVRLYRDAPRGDVRRMLRHNLRGFCLRISVVVLVLGLSWSIWEFGWNRRDEDQIQRILADATIEIFDVTPTIRRPYETYIEWAESLALACRVEEALRVVRAIDDMEKRVWGLAEVAVALQRRGRTDEACNALDEALQAARAPQEFENSSLKPMLLGMVALARARCGRPETEIRQVADEALQSDHLQSGGSDAVLLVVKAWCRVGKVDEARRIAKSIEGGAIECIALGMVAAALFGCRGREVEAHNTLKEATQAARASGSLTPYSLAAIAAALARVGQTDLASNIAGMAAQGARAEDVMLYKDLGLHGAARSFILSGQLEKALEIVKEIGFKHCGDLLKRDLLRALVQAGRVNDARRVAGELEGDLQAHCIIAKTLIEVGRWADGKRLVEETVAKAHKLPMPADRSFALAEAAKVLASLGLLWQARLTCGGCSKEDKLGAYAAILTAYTEATQGNPSGQSFIRSRNLNFIWED